MNNAIKTLEERLNKRIVTNSLRSLSLPSGIDLSSNDYLGLARSAALKTLIDKRFGEQESYYNGSTGSRLLSGNSELAEELERKIATFHGAEAGLLFNSGYDANIGLFSCIAQRHDTILYDELCHASIIDGICLSHATSYKFAHNNIQDLEAKLSRAPGNVFIAIESVYSMDGGISPLEELCVLAKKYDANLIVDEAHATGVIGEQGKGLVNALQLEHYVFARMHTFGKAVGVHGAIILGSSLLRKYLLNFARSFIYSTALPPYALLAIGCAYDVMEEAHDERKALQWLTLHFKNTAAQYRNIALLDSNSPIQSILVHGNARAKSVSVYLRKSGFDVRPILSPTVAQGKERLRICLHSFNTEVEINRLLQNISENL
jgi:8-amino-7-oxononanoate synthase